MRPSSVRFVWAVCLVFLSVVLAAMTLWPDSPSDVLAEPLVPATARASATRVVPSPTITLPPIVATPSTATATSNVVPTPTARPANAQPRVGIQVGHWHSDELPEELARLRTSTGAHAAGIAEVNVNLAVAQRVAALLTARGIAVDLLPATVPPSYDADAFVAIHADGSSSTGARGFKLATPWRTSQASQHLLDTVTAEYAAATGLPQDGAITFNMRGYYAFSYSRHVHAIAKTTPAIIVETGFLTNPTDRTFLLGHQDRIAAGIVNGIVRYLGERDPNDRAALVPPEFKTQRSVSPNGVDIRSAPRANASVLLHADASRRFMPFQERDGWYQVFVRGGGSRVVGWVPKDQLTETNEPTPTPLPATDS